MIRAHDLVTKVAPKKERHPWLPRVLVRGSAKLVCDSCHIRQELGHPMPELEFNKVPIDAHRFSTLRNIASAYDAECEEAGILTTAQEFLDWIEPDIPGTSRNRNQLQYRRDT